MAKRLSGEDKGFCQGVACALAILARQFDQPTMAADILGEMGITVGMLEAARVEPYDIEPLRKAQRPE